MSSCTQLVPKAFQPPADGAPLLEIRRVTMLCQSIGWTSTLKPAFSSCCFTTGAICLITPRSVGCGITMTVPS